MYNWMCSQLFWRIRSSGCSTIHSSHSLKLKIPTKEVFADQAFTFSIQILQLKMLVFHSITQMFTFLIQAAWEREPFSGRRILPSFRTVLWSSYFQIYPTWPFVSEECPRWCKSYLSLSFPCNLCSLSSPPPRSASQAVCWGHRASVETQIS